jgi:hypothetical protein
MKTAATRPRGRSTRTMAQAPTRKRQLLFVGIVLLMLLLVLEGLLQLFYFATAGDFLFHRAQPAIFEEDPLRCYRVMPNLAYEHSTNEFTMMNYTNAQGFRTGPARETVPYAKRPGVTRILFLGPSFAYGWGTDFEDTYAARIVEELGARGHEVELLNLGTPAQGTAHQLCWLAAEGVKFEPDLIVQTDYGSIGAVATSCPEVLSCPTIEGGELYQSDPTPARRLVASAKNSALVFYGYYLIHAFDEAPAGNTGEGKELHGLDAEQAVDAAANYRGYRRFVRETLGEDVDVSFLYLPLAFVVHPEDAPRWWSMGEVDPYQHREHIKRTVEDLLGAGVPVIDATPSLIRAGESERMYFWLDIHLTAAGNRVVSDVAVPRLEAQLRARAANEAPAARTGSR